MARNLDTDCSFLSQNKTPLNQEGKELQILDYSNSNLTDTQLFILTNSLQFNSSFRGKIDLSNNLITDQGILQLTRILSNSKTPIKALNISSNNLKQQSGVYLGNYLGLPNNQLQELNLSGNNLQNLGIQRILQKLPDNQKLETLKIGLVSCQTLSILCNYIPFAGYLKNFGCQQSGIWTEDDQLAISRAFRANLVLRNIELEAESPALVQELNSFAKRNLKQYHHELHEQELESVIEPENYEKQIQEYLDNAIQSLPIRLYLNEALETILNDGMYELFKFRAKENVPENHTAVNNIKWLVRYIIDKHLK